MSFLLGNWKAIALGMVALFIVTTVWAANTFVTGLVNQVSLLEANKAKTDQALTIQSGTIESLSANADDWAASREQLYKDLETAQQLAYDASAETRRLNDLFSKHDLEELARKKPGLIERRSTDSTNRAIRLLECKTRPGDYDCSIGNGNPG